MLNMLALLLFLLLVSPFPAQPSLSIQNTSSVHPSLVLSNHNSSIHPLHNHSISILSTLSATQKQPLPDPETKLQRHAAQDYHQADEIQSNPQTEEHVGTRNNLIARVSSLSRRNRHMKKLVNIHRQANLQASINIQRSLQRRSDMHAAKHAFESDRLHAERHLHKIRRLLPLYTRSLQVLNRQAGMAILEITRLRESNHAVIGDKLRLIENFRHHGLEHWVESALKGSVNPVVADVFVEGAANVVEPLLDGIERLASVNDELATSLKQTVPIVEKPFYSAFVTTTVLLCPLVLVLSILLKIKRGISKLTAGHIIILGNFYFSLLSGGCFIATILGSVDVLQTFRHGHLRLFDSAMVLHGIIFVSHFYLHALDLYRSCEKHSAINLVLLVIIGTHFFIHSYSHALRNEDPHVDKAAYAGYTVVFLYILYGLTVKQLLQTQQDPSLKLNNTSISSKPPPQEALLAVKPKKGNAKTLLRLPEKRVISQLVPPYSRPEIKQHAVGNSRPRSGSQSPHMTDDMQLEEVCINVESDAHISLQQL